MSVKEVHGYTPWDRILRNQVGVFLGGDELAVNATHEWARADYMHSLVRVSNHSCRTIKISKVRIAVR